MGNQSINNQTDANQGVSDLELRTEEKKAPWGRVKVEMMADKGGREGQLLEMVPEPRTRRWKEGRRARGVGRARPREGPALRGEGCSSCGLEEGGAGGRGEGGGRPSRRTFQPVWRKLCSPGGAAGGPLSLLGEARKLCQSWR